MKAYAEIRCFPNFGGALTYPNPTIVLNVAVVNLTYKVTKS
jgi:hypothetical protein